ncbi:hypothetical protein HJ044_04965 [Vibrio parahaemolyticus]|nr:hypothetical protein [Vibrio parahaemolyticus]
MKFDNLEQFDAYYEQLKQQYETKHNDVFDLSNPHVKGLIEKLISIRLDIVMATFDESFDPTNFDSYVR